MRNQWYSDKRDLVKWASLIHLASENKIRQIVQVAFLRPDDPRYELDVDGQSQPFPDSVLRHFRNILNIDGLARKCKIDIRVFSRDFSGQKDKRTDYLEGLKSYLRKSGKSPKIVFLDPDTGLATGESAFKHKHVLSAEVYKAYQMLHEGDCLVLYQHAPLYKRNTDWRGGKRREFAEAIRCDPKDIIELKSLKVASDVVFFAAWKRT